MVAFIGAVICIIAAVHSASPAAVAAQPLADNQSLSPDSAVRTIAPDSAAQPGPWDALHGTDSSRERGGPEAPTFYGLSGVVTEGGERQVTYSRLICTPIPAGECKPKNFQQQADDPSLYAGEDWGYLRTTADELRQTVLQQKDEILTDQRTIRELTGKLSECEVAMGERSVPAKSAGLWGGKRDVGDIFMMRDEPPSSGMNARAVEELEKAISQMRDRIEKLEADMGPLVHNHTEEGQRGMDGVAGSPSRPVEELQGELEAKVEQLKRERKALRRESQKHQQHIQQGLHSLHQRVSELEQGQSKFTLVFPRQSDAPYVGVRRRVPEMHAFTVCLWLRPVALGTVRVVSYSTPELPNELALLLGANGQSELVINGQVALLPLNLSVGKWQHVCVSWNRKGGVWQTYQDGTMRGNGKDLATRHSIQPAGALTLGKQQVASGPTQDPALIGEMSQFNLWDHQLTHHELVTQADCSGGILGNVVPWNSRDLDMFGGVTKEPVEPCAKRPSAQE